MYTSSHCCDVRMLNKLVQVISILILFILICHCTFFDRKDPQKFEELKDLVDNLLTTGNWVNAWKVPHFKPLYALPCINVKGYTRDLCFSSLANQGYRWIWKPQLIDDRGALTISSLSPSETNSIHKHWLWSYKLETSEMCRIMKGRNLMFVGDSLNEENFWVLLSSLWSHYILKPHHNSTMNKLFREQQLMQCESYCPDVAPSCEGPLTIDCGDALPPFNISFTSESHLQLFESNGVSLERWARKIVENNVSLLIMNTGAHYIPDEELLHNINESLSYVRSSHPTVDIIYRSTSPGHNNCGDTFKSDPMLENDALRLVMGGPANYHWSDFSHQNQKVKMLVKKQFPSVMYMDIYNATVLRADAHPTVRGDCLHYCTPGPVDDWTLFLFNILRLNEWAQGQGQGMSEGEGSHTELEQKEPEPQSIVEGGHHAEAHGNVPKGQHSVSIVLDKARTFEGQLVRARSQSAIYIVRNMTRHVFGSMDELASMGCDTKDLRVIEDMELYHIHVGKPVALLMNAV